MLQLTMHLWLQLKRVTAQELPRDELWLGHVGCHPGRLWFVQVSKGYYCSSRKAFCQIPSARFTANIFWGDEPDCIFISTCVINRALVYYRAGQHQQQPSQWEHLKCFCIFWATVWKYSKSIIHCRKWNGFIIRSLCIMLAYRASNRCSENDTMQTL